MPQLPFKSQSGSSLPMIIILLALMAGFVFYFQIIRPGESNEYGLLPDIQKELSKFRVFKNMHFDFSILEQADFKNLRIFGESPVKTAPGGKADLFSQ